MVAGHRYYTAGGPLPTTRETQSHLNRLPDARLVEAVVGGARTEGARGRG